MDDCYLIYLEFPPWSDNGESDAIKHQIVPYTQQPTEELMSAREAFVFSVYRGLKASSRLRHLSDGEAIVQFSHQPRLKGTFGGRKRPAGKDGDRAGSSKRITRQSLKGGGNTDSSDLHNSTSSSVFGVDSLVTLELDALVEVDSSKPSGRVGRDSGYGSSETNADDLRSGTKIRYLSSFNHCTALFTLESPLRLPTLSIRPSTLLVAKYFPDCSDAMHEATSYRHCADLQGSVLPYSYGVFTLRQKAGFVLLLSYTPWPTVEDCHLWPSNRWEMVLEKSMAGLDRLHSYGVSHRDLRGPNILVRVHEEAEGVENIDVMFVDLGNSRSDYLTISLVFPPPHLRATFW
ncbi:MAG: hypothetical protein M1840_008926 [Geoglossum simile]|nr:MAG: hypothetical protein M1840_008926 [Geoglossum simile]